MSITPAEINAYISEVFPGNDNECTELGPTWALARYVVKSTNIRPGGYVSGPTQFSLADAVLWYALFAAVGSIEPMSLTSELSIRFLRPAAGEVLWGRADLHTVGRRNVVGTITMWMDDRTDKPVSVAQGTYVRPVS